MHPPPRVMLGASTGAPTTRAGQRTLRRDPTLMSKPAAACHHSGIAPGLDTRRRPAWTESILTHSKLLGSPNGSRKREYMTPTAWQRMAWKHALTPSSVAVTEQGATGHVESAEASQLGFSNAGKNWVSVSIVQL
ncbi:hypothetical protein OH76DRAFT_1424379, partial [Lentinus brumalis]